MNAQAAGAIGGTAPSNHFNAHLALADGVSVSIHAPTLADLSNVVAKLQPVEAVSDPDPDPMAGKSVKNVAKPAPTPAPHPQGNGSASTGTPASAPAASGGSAASGAGEKPPTYDDVKARVLALAKAKGRDAAAGLLQEFKGVNGQPVDNANKLQLPDYAAFIAKADAQLLAGAGT